MLLNGTITTSLGNFRGDCGRQGLLGMISLVRFAGVHEAAESTDG